MFLYIKLVGFLYQYERLWYRKCDRHNSCWNHV